MKSRFFRLAAIAALSICAISRADTHAPAGPLIISQRIVAPIPDEAPGLLGIYFKDVADWQAYQKASTPWLVRVDQNVWFRKVTGQFAHSKLGANFAVRWTGMLRVPKPGVYTFRLQSDDSSRLTLGDQIVIDNMSPESMKEKSGAARLEAGEYPIKVELHQAGGEVGCNLGWKRPGAGKFDAISNDFLTHPRHAENIAFDKQAFAKAKYTGVGSDKPYEMMDYGPFVSGSFWAGDTSNIALKALAIHVGKDREASVMFDTEMLRYSAAWTGDFLDFHGVGFDGQHGVNPQAAGDLVYVTKFEPGAWEGALSDKPLADPRHAKWGPLPREWGRYKGLYEDGDKIVLNYTVGQTEVWETPGEEMANDLPVFTRTIRLSASDKPLALLANQIDKEPTKRVKFSTPPGVSIKEIDGRNYLVFAPRKKTTTYKVAIAPIDVSNSTLIAAATSVEDIPAMTKGGPSHWGAPLETHGILGAGTGAYVVDSLNPPEKNPYHSWLRFAGLDFFPDGRAAACTWNGDVWIISGIDDKLEHVQWKRYATGMFQTLGLKIVNNEVYVLGRDQITHLHDLNGDGEADWYECFNNDCEVTPGFHEFSFDLQTDPQGNFYFAKAGTVKPGGRGFEYFSDHNGCILKISPDGKQFSVYASGLRAPNGLCISPSGLISCTDNEGTWTPACRIDYDVKQGDFLGVPENFKPGNAPKDPGNLMCWLPHGDVDNSSGGEVWDLTANWGPFQNKLLHTSYGKCTLFNTLIEKVDGVYQGGCVAFPLHFDTGLMRPRFNPVDNQLYIAGLKGWQTDGTRDTDIQRVRYTGKPVVMPNDMHVYSDGISITWTNPLDASLAADLQNYAIEQWNLHYTSDYGSKEYSVENPKQVGHDPVDIESATLSPDGKTIFLKIDGVKPVMQMKIQMKLKGADGAPANYTIYNTIQKVPHKTGSPVQITKTADAK
jgi:hypothetical protein